MKSTEQLPASVATAWGIRDGSPRRRPHGLSLERIVSAGLRIATSEGLAGVSMNRVARELGAAPMSLYRHVTAKDELLAHMVDATFAQAPPPPEPGEGWRAGLARWAGAYLTILRRHPWLVRVPIGGPPVMPNQVLWFERGLACLGSTRLAEAEKPSTLLLVNGFVRNHATLESDLLIAAHASGVSPEAAGADYGALLARLTDAERFPALHALLAARVFSGDAPIQDDFQFGLDRILDGIDVLVRARAGDARPDPDGERQNRVEPAGPGAHKAK